jgi:AraC-like DNA-binding protein
VSGYIRSRRLEHCRIDLVDPALASRSIIQVAQSWGFVDPSHFSKLFKSTFGHSPRDYRQLHLGVSLSA